MSDEHLSIGFDDLTFDELDLLEEILGMEFEQILEAKRTKMMRGLAFIAKRRSDPDFPWEDAGSLKVSAVVDRSERPTEASD